MKKIIKDYGNWIGLAIFLLATPIDFYLNGGKKSDYPPSTFFITYFISIMLWILIQTYMTKLEESE